MDLDPLFGEHWAIRVPRAAPHFNEVDHACRKGRLVRLLPSVFVRSGSEGLPLVRAAAACLHDPAAVLTAHSAMALHVGHGDWPPVITLLSPRRWTCRRPWLRVTTGTMPPDHVRPFPLPHAEPAAALLQAATVDGAGLIDDALRARWVTPHQLLRAVESMRGSPGNGIRRRIAAGSVQRPWSSGERDLHALLFGAGIGGWRGNAWVRGRRRRYVVDILFPAERVVIELDGWTYHSSSTAFEADRARHNDLTAAGWTVLHLTPDMVRNDPSGVVALIRHVLRPAA